MFDPALGGDPLLFQHLFWFYSHPAVYIMILPGFGVVSEIVTAFSRKSIFGYKFIAWSSVAIAIISFFVWGHHMFVAGTSIYSALVFSLLSFFVAVPSAIKVFNWLGTLHKGFIRFDAPMLYALGFIGLFTIGGLTGLFVAALASDVHLTQTYFVVAHFHYIMVGAMVSAFFGGLHYWWPKITGRMYPEAWAQVAALLIFFGFNVTFFPQFLLGYLRHAAPLRALPAGVPGVNVLSSAGATILAVAYLMPLVYLTWSLFRGARAPANPWQRDRARMADPVAAAHREFRGHAGHHQRAVRLSTAGGARACRLARARGRTAAVEIQYRDRRYQSETARSGMWLFLASEMLFFGALILTWGFYRIQHASGFAEATRETEFAIGTANTVVLVTSSFAFACAVAFARRGENRRVMWASVLTGLLGIVFLGLKGLEWYKDIVKGDVPGALYHTPGGEGGAQLFWMFYWIGTVLHGLHLLIGIGLVGWIAWRARRAHSGPRRPPRSRWSGSTGASSIWSGSCCTRSSISRGGRHEHRSPPGTGLARAAALLAVEAALGRVLGWGNVSLALGVLMAATVAVFFMEVDKGPGVIRVFAWAGVFWLFVLLGLGLMDPLTRHTVTIGTGFVGGAISGSDDR